MRRSTEAAWDAAIAEVLERTKMVRPDGLVTEINAATRRLGVEVTVYLVDHEQERLWPLPREGEPLPPPQAVDDTPAGRAFTTLRTQIADESSHRLWVPMVDGSERLGVAEVVAHRPPDDLETFRSRCEMLLGLVGHLITVKLPYGDALQVARRTRPMSPASELVLQMLPPLTFSCHRLVVSAVLEPCYDVGGDAYDYAIDGSLARVMVLDAMGRGLAAGLTSATAIAAIRAARRAGQGVEGTARAADAALAEQFPDVRFVTGVLAELDLDTGVLHYVNAGHPAPLLIRGGRVVRRLTEGRRRPLGIADDAAAPGRECLEPGDRLLLYTDGVTEEHEWLVGLTERCLAEQLPAPETVRRLARTALARQGGTPPDEATLLLVEWSAEAARRTQV